MLGGKAGIVNIHMGDARNPFAPIEEAVAKSELKHKQFYPTHCNRNTYIYEDAKTFGKKGYIDVTSSSYPFFSAFEVKPSKALAGFLEAGVPVGHITMTSDGNGSLPHFNEQGELVQLEMGQPGSILSEIRDTVLQEQIPLETAIRFVSSNVAAILKLKGKGMLAPGADADLLVLSPDLQVRDVLMRGKVVVEDGEPRIRGTYE
jgi:beta-aspartyl-dipeptidase (metallo-type)